ncbi:MAG TPA: hypothetical protein VD905_02200 [Flavobacteriales bacterium]|nr:hypothetical protein [Flavobacteriales bacterium]
MKYPKVPEQEIKNKISRDYFYLYDCTKVIGNIDFCVYAYKSKSDHSDDLSLLWAEAKKGRVDIYKSLAQLILTIGKARTFDKFLPPVMLGTFDSEKIAFIPYNEIHGIFYQNDFNWNVTPSNYNTKEFKLIYSTVKNCIEKKSLLFRYESEDKELQKFIKTNFVVGKFGLTKTKIDKNNFMVIYTKWLQSVKPSIAVDWEIAKKSGIIDGDFYLADLLSIDNTTLKEKLFVLLKKDHYELDRKLDDAGMFSSKRTEFKDNQKSHLQFWNKYERPPGQEYWSYIIERRDLLVPQDIRERKGSYFTPQIWVELSQKYLTAALGEDWQDEYYIWDCAAGTGNLLNGLTNKYNIWASTLDQADIEVMQDRIRNGANLLENHVFQFDFLNDDFSKLPAGLREIIHDEKKCRKLLIYINPPYAEGDTVSEKEVTRKGVASSKTYNDYFEILGKARGELFAQFFIRIYKNIPNAKLASFSTLKYINAENFIAFRNSFLAKYKSGFVVIANTFDNVVGKFPIGFIIWDLSVKQRIDTVKCDVVDSNSTIIGKKTFCNYDGKIKFMNEWLKKFNDGTDSIGKLGFVGNDFQNQKLVFITNKGRGHHEANISTSNLQISCIYFAVRHNSEHTWLNHNDQFLFPGGEWEKDTEFHNDCLTFTLFHDKNQVTSGINYWIPFTEKEINAREKFESDFMAQFIKGKLKREKAGLFDEGHHGTIPLEFSTAAIAVFNAGKELWKYYHKQPDCNVNASLYNIKEYFQGRNEKGKMNAKSNDEMYMHHISNLREKLKQLASKINPKIYEYGFLKN